MDLREEIAKVIEAAVDDPNGHWRSWVSAADRILAIPEIAEALAFKRAFETPGGIKIVPGPPLIDPRTLNDSTNS